MTRKVFTKKSIKLYVIAFFILATLAFIWGNSMRSIEASSRTSMGIFELIKPLLEVFLGSGNATEHHVRKLAHFLQFGLLGSELALLIIITERVRLQGVINCAFFGLCAAVMDETIQIFSLRGPQVSDILIDFAGLCAGIGAIIAVYLLFRCKNRTRHKQDDL